MLLNKAQYRITDVVWYLHRNTNGGEIELRSSAVTSWTATNASSETIAYRYTLADGTTKNENELYRHPLIAVSRLLDPLKKNRWFADLRSNNIWLLPNVDNDALVRTYLMNEGRYYYIRENFKGIDLTEAPFGNVGEDGISILFYNYFEQCSFANCIGKLYVIGISFINCNFSMSYFRESRFKHCNLDGSNFKDSNFYGCMFSFSTLNGCNMQNADFRGSCNFKYAKIRKANFKDALLEHVWCKGADLRESIFDNASMNDAVFIEANLSGCSMKEVVIPNGNFQMAIMTGIDMSEAFIKDCDFIGAKGITNEQLYAFANKDADEYTFTGVDGSLITVPTPEE